MSARTRLRGEPVLVLALLLGGWVGLRVAFWESPFPQAAVTLPEALLAKTVPLDGPAPAEPENTGGGARPAASQAAEQAPTTPVPVQVDPLAPAPAPALPEALRPQPVPFVAPSPMPSAPSAPPITQRLAAAHNMVMMAGLSGVSLPPELAQLLEKKDAPAEASEVGASGEQPQQ